MIENEKNAKWEETISNEEVIIGECLNGYQGFATRSCIQYGSIANWTSVSGSCNGTLSFYFISFFSLFFLFFYFSFLSFFFLFLFLFLFLSSLTGKKKDINECLVNNGGCDMNANCTNTIGSRNCTCKTGYSGNGFNCDGNINIHLSKTNSFLNEKKNERY